MAIAKVQSAALLGVDAFPVDVEVALTNSLPGLKTLGLPDASQREGKDRILLALRHQKLIEARPSVVVNLAPSGVRKSGPGFELAIAIGILFASQLVPREAARGWMVIGELSLDGQVRPTRGVLAVAALARTLGSPALVVPRANAREAALVEGLRVVAVDTLRDLADGLAGRSPLEPYVPAPELEPGEEPEEADYRDVRGQGQARRAAEIAAAGGHNLLLVGPPGSGKTMIARRLPGILPPLTLEEAIASTRIRSAAGLLRAGQGLVRRRPFRSPHHTISTAGLVGGYSPPRPGEVSLAHNGVLFLDEMAEFSRMSLEALREPLEEGRVRVVRGGIAAVFPARSALVAATNPCPCGYLGDPVKRCGCTPALIQRYRGRLSGPLLDRIDLHVEVPRLAVRELMGAEAAEGSAAIAARVHAARQVQIQRSGVVNAQLGEEAARALVPLGAEERRALDLAVERLALSPRGCVRVLKVARTAADLEGSQKVRLPHLLEAIQYRCLDRGTA